MAIPADISGMSIEQLLEHQKVIAQAIEQRRAQQRAAGLEKILSIMLEHDIKPKDISSALAAKERELDAVVLSRVTVTGNQQNKVASLAPNHGPVTVERDAAAGLEAGAEKGKTVHSGAVGAVRPVGRPARAMDAIEGRGKDGNVTRFEQVRDVKPARGGNKVFQKYRDPDTGQGWTGNGLRPKWLNEKMAAGAQLSDFLVK